MTFTQRGVASIFLSLTHLSRMYFPIPINWSSPFPILGLLGGVFHLYSNFKRNFCKQTVENLIRRRILRRLIWCCTVCRCPTKRTLCLYGFNCPSLHGSCVRVGKVLVRLCRFSDSSEHSLLAKGPKAHELVPMSQVRGNQFNYT